MASGSFHVEVSSIGNKRIKATLTLKDVEEMVQRDFDNYYWGDAATIRRTRIVVNFMCTQSTWHVLRVFPARCSKPSKCTDWVHIFGIFCSIFPAAEAIRRYIDYDGTPFIELSHPPGERLTLDVENAITNFEKGVADERKDSIYDLTDSARLERIFQNYLKAREDNFQKELLESKIETLKVSHAALKKEAKKIGYTDLPKLVFPKKK